MTITLLCAGALAVPGGADDPTRRRELLSRFAPAGSGSATRWLERQAFANPKRLRDENVPPAEMPEEQWLRGRFGVAHAESVAAFATRGETLRLQLRLVHLQLGRDRLVLAAEAAVPLSEAHALALAATANAHFRADGLELVVQTPLVWTLSALDDRGRARVAELSTLQCHSARMAEGRSIDAWSPRGPAQSRWRAFLSELQMCWHEHAVNEERAAHGLAPVNSAWLEGYAGTPSERPFGFVLTTDEAVSGLGLASGAEVSACPPGARVEDIVRLLSIRETAGDVLVDPGGWRHADVQGDAQRWQQAWQRLDQLIDKLHTTSERITRLVLTGERDALVFDARPRPAWLPWSRGRSAMHWLQETS